MSWDRRRTVKGAARLADRLRRPRPGIVILIYHRIGAGMGGQMDLPVADFDRQMAWLAGSHRVIDLDTAAAELTAGGTVEPGVVVTFDDGTPDWVDHALPVLQRHGVPATFYVATGFVENRRAWPDGCPPITWAALGELASSPLVTIGSHTHTHALLDRVDVAVARVELDRSRDLLGERLGVHPCHFAYPKAIPATGAVAAEVVSRFATATIAGTRANTAGADVHLLHRSPIQSSDSPDDVEAKVAGGMWLEDDLRRLAGRVRHRRATS
jgi:peptidoglycan/xylan/chitin deacetylase (PgdA/CDA1 family)